jgi:hypothetical protein
MGTKPRVRESRQGGVVDEGKEKEADKKPERSVQNRASGKPYGTKEMERRSQETDAICVRPS